MRERDVMRRRIPVLIIGRGHRPGRVSFGPEVVVEGVTDELREIAPCLSVHVEPRNAGKVLRLLLRRSTRVVHFLSTGRWSLLAPLIRLLPGKRVIATLHGYAPLGQIPGAAAKLQQVVSILQARLGMLGAHVIVSVSDQLHRRTSASFPHARHLMIRNGLSPRFSRAAGTLVRPGRSQDGPLRLLIVGFGRHKGVEGVLETLETLPPRAGGGADWTLTLVGVRPAMRGYADGLQRRYAHIWDRVTVMEAVPHETMPEIYRRHDLLLLWSSHDSFGLVVLEAMANGVIPVVSDRVGAREVIAEGVNGYVVPLGDRRGLAAVILEAQRGASTVRREEMQKTAEESSMRKSAEAYAGLYKELLGPGPRLCFVTNICPHYRVKTFELLGRALPTRFFFFSDPRRERFWEHANPSRLGDFDGRYVRGIGIPGTRLRLIPGLYASLLAGRYDVLVKCINGKLPLLLSFLIARMRGKRFVLWTGLWHHPSTSVHRIGRPVVHWIYHRANAIVVYGEHVRRHLLEAGIPAERLFVAPQAIDAKGFSCSAPPARDAGTERGSGAVILFVGRLEDHKGVSYLLHACARLPRDGWTLEIVGEGGGRRTYERLARELGLRQVVFHGHVENNVLAAYYRRATVLVLPSITTPEFREPWGLVTNEAFSQGCPVVVSDAVGAAAGGMVVDGVNGLVVPEKSTDALTSALRRILGDGELRARLAAGAARTSPAWTQERMVQGFLDAACAW